MSGKLGASEKGRDIFKLSPHRLSVEDAVAAVGSASCGAISLFIGTRDITSCLPTATLNLVLAAGTTREDQSESGKVIGLEYEAYEPMVQSELAELCRRLRARWPDLAHICVHHRLGSRMSPSSRLSR